MAREQRDTPPQDSEPADNGALGHARTLVGCLIVFGACIAVPWAVGFRNTPMLLAIICVTGAIVSAAGVIGCVGEVAMLTRLWVAGWWWSRALVILRWVRSRFQRD